MDDNYQRHEVKFSALWEEVKQEHTIFDSMITTKHFKLEDDKSYYVLENSEKKLEMVEAESVEEAINKSTLKDIIKVYRSTNQELHPVIDNNILK